MSLPSEDDREAIDRAFADLIADFDRDAGEAEGYHPDQPPAPEPPQPRVQPGLWDDQLPLFQFEAPPPPEPEPPFEADPRFEADARYVPEPQPPIARPGWPVLVAWVALGYAILALIAAIVGVRLPAWAGWLAIGGFVGGLALLVTRLPKHRPPGSGDGAVL